MGEGAVGGVLALAGDIIAASAALAGFILVYLSALATAYAGFPRADRRAVRASFQWRGWFAFIGILFCAAACATAALAKWMGSSVGAGFALLFFGLAIFWAALSALLLVLEIE
ncbi:hypothetical protein BKD09_24465 [Bradyrhizobium japonicum]|uniref:Uncharacterized protein n=1 Tax=Bradyrhizobium japonicum TaxID=375 RepID=A0A1L3FDY8_BRAJP|nr:hypothetical protein BKD09_24465 [Bradyrhizobium japonicum]